VQRKSDQRPYNVAYYAAHRDEEIERVRVRQAATLEFLRDLRRRPCQDCGGTFPPWVMDFDHRDPREKKFSILEGRDQLKSRAALLEEIAKCDIVCANCHAVRTYEWVRANKATLSWFTVGVSSRIEEKRVYWKTHTDLLAKLRDVPCLDCGRRFAFYVMHFDHRNGTQKRATISQMISRAGTKTILAEVAKCDIVCANCHRERTYRRRAASAGVL
jgi:hypothetical protein